MLAALANWLLPLLVRLAKHVGRTVMLDVLVDATARTMAGRPGSRRCCRVGSPAR